MKALYSLRLSRNQLSGGIPKQIGNLTSLWTLFLDHNQLSGDIPSSLGSLKSLDWLRLNNNQLSGSIPPSLSNLNALTKLELNNNRLSGRVPMGLSSLTGLTSLWLDHNYLSGELPASLTNLLNLNTLTIDYTCLIEPQDIVFQAWLDRIFYIPNRNPRPECCLASGRGIPVEPGNIVFPHTCGPLGPKDSWEDKQGNRFELSCTVSQQFGQHFLLRYVTADGSSDVSAGQCLWAGGLNYGKIISSGNSDRDDKFNCFISSFWRSDEPYANQGVPTVSDWVTYNFDVASGTLTVRYFWSVDGPGGIWEDTLLSPASSEHSETFIYQADNPPMIASPFEPCDNDRDGDCDTDDFDLVKNAIGQCFDGSNYNELADADHDGCVTLSDLQDLFPKLIYLPIILKNSP